MGADSATYRAATAPVLDAHALAPVDPQPALDATRTPRAYEAIVAHVQRLVAARALLPGDKLPSERELAERFHVGRSSVRDAIRILEVKGLVKARQGGGTVVQDPGADSLVEVLAGVIISRRSMVEELMDVRTIIEPPLAARAAVNATPEQLAAMEAILARQREKLRRGESTVEEDFAFHNAIASAAGNGVVLAVLDTLINLLSETRRRTLQVKGRAEASLAGHRRVLRAVQRRDPAAAEEAMRRHVRSVEVMIARKA